MGNIVYKLDASTLKPVVIVGNGIYKSTNVLGSSDIWKKQKRVTDGKWYTPEKLGTFNLSITYTAGELRVYLNGLLDQTIIVDGLVLGDVILGGFNGRVAEYFIYDRMLSQDEVKALYVLQKRI